MEFQVVLDHGAMNEYECGYYINLIKYILIFLQQTMTISHEERTQYRHKQSHTPE